MNMHGKLRVEIEMSYLLMIVQVLAVPPESLCMYRVLELIVDAVFEVAHCYSMCCVYYNRGAGLGKVKSEQQGLLDWTGQRSDLAVRARTGRCAGEVTRGFLGDSAAMRYVVWSCTSAY
jgi:hypothetical protein